MNLSTNQGRRHTNYCRGVRDIKGNARNVRKLALEICFRLDGNDPKKEKAITFDSRKKLRDKVGEGK